VIIKKNVDTEKNNPPKDNLFVKHIDTVLLLCDLFAIIHSNSDVFKVSLSKRVYV